MGLLWALLTISAGVVLFPVLPAGGAIKLHKDAPVAARIQPHRLADEGLTFITSNWELHRLHPFTIEWTGHDGPVDISLVRADGGFLAQVVEVTTGNEESSVIFKPPSFLPDADVGYHFRVVDKRGNVAMSPRIGLEGRQFSDSASASFGLPPPPPTTEPPTPTTTPFSPGPTTEPGSTKDPTSTPRPTSTSTSPANADGSTSNSLSPGAYAGIGIGAAAAFFLLVGFIGWAIWTAYQKGKTASAAAQQPQAGVDTLQQSPPPGYQPQPMQGVYAAGPQVPAAAHTVDPKYAAVPGAGVGDQPTRVGRNMPLELPERVHTPVAELGHREGVGSGTGGRAELPGRAW